ncbi:MAG: hypothetical protein E7572_11340 [Ruminococcaceae bacterium]|nr:hypothetical protein [Oscillospiraceae bacterium]
MTKSRKGIETERGIKLWVNHSVQVKGAFGVLKSDRRFKRVLTWGRTNISTELYLLCMGCKLKQAVGKMQHRKAENAFVLPSKRINSEKTKNDGSVGCSEKCRHCTAVPFNFLSLSFSPKYRQDALINAKIGLLQNENFATAPFF